MTAEPLATDGAEMWLEAEPLTIEPFGVAVVRTATRSELEAHRISANKRRHHRRREDPGVEPNASTAESADAPSDRRRSRTTTIRRNEEMAVPRKKATVALSVIAVVAALAASSLTAGAGAPTRRHPPSRAPRRCTRRARRGGRSPSSTRCAAAATRPARSGLLYETLFRYDPLKDTYIPWLATDGKWVGSSYVVHRASGREVERRQATDRRRREVHVRDRQARRLGATRRCGRPASRASLVKGNTVSFVFKGKPNYLDWNTNIYSFGIVPQAPLEELQRDRDHDRQHERQVHGRHRPVHLRRRQGHVRHAAVEPAQRLVGDEGARAEDADAVPRRHPQHPEHRVAAELPQERHRPQQQLLPRGRQVDRREGADLLQEGCRTCSRRTPPGSCRTPRTRR